MSDLFISYSRKDSGQALDLVERLRASGIDVWIDQHGIEAAASWSKEIVKAIDECTALVVLISESSMLSENVTKEVSIACEAKKKVLPVAIEDIRLNDDLRYHLAGIQRVAYTQFDAIVAALKGFGIDAKSAPGPAPSTRKNLMVLPFADLSPTQDNEWFTDGVASELIVSLSQVKALRVVDWNTSRLFKDRKVKTLDLARELGARYFIEGAVRKFGDQIKITVSLLDVESGDHLWHDALKGEFKDIFDIQELVAEKVVAGLELHLGSDERRKLSERGTENAEAYELYMKAIEYFERQTRAGLEHSIQLLTEAMTLDPGYAQAYRSKAHALTGLYRGYDRSPALLDEAEALCREALRLKPEMLEVYQPLSLIHMYRGNLAEAEHAAREYVRLDPDNPNGHEILGFFFMESGDAARAIAPFEEANRLKPESISILWNLAINCDNAGEEAKARRYALAALPLVERHLKFKPDDEAMRVQHCVLLLVGGRSADAHAAAMTLTNLRDGNPLFNAANLLSRLGEPQEALRTFRKAIEAGFSSIAHLKDFLCDDEHGILSLAGTPEHSEATRMVEELEAKTQNDD